MAAPIKVYLIPGVYTIINPNMALLENKGKATPFGDYVEYHGHISFIRDICSDDGRSIQKNIDWVTRHPRPAFTEIFEEVRLIDEESKKVLITLWNVDLNGILQDIMEYLGGRKKE